MKSGDYPERHVKDLTHRVDRVEQILPTLATKLDLERFATKDDLQAFATKEDLKGFATKDDLKGFATKDDLKAFATKDDLKAFPTRDEMREAIQEAVGQVRVLFEDQAHLIRLMADNLTAHLHRHETLERRVDGHDAALESLDLRVRRIEPPRPRRGR